MSNDAQPFVAILMGSDSDLPVVQGALDVLADLEVACEVKILSAHRTPDATREYVKEAEARGCAVFIAAAGMAAHLAGAVAAHTVKPVIGIPVDAGPLQGFDALLSTVQMPPGVPVATMAVGKAGARNAGHLAAQILALADGELAERVARERRRSAEAVAAKDRALAERPARGSSGSE
ncbi:MAG: 5-(carboxyamino)imidazole ribonucleotide mutase [Gammaproteobacteria bacterium]|nr:5-(carboxyamino)imidazole ribonucleotide mutase [Gammaproteobacteria bacterium]NIR81785.1 5-(carboxyamino)imidazole ribonucleotide mutase [Gammaproteobacteria bacterium]NIR88617.1 5-(carboxyamino)imidazole ribonucleotide mutase [Gammaproteobacteria bacterium]NIU02893.1 5-(carboxyamino)imidazole ribonucleotide mutase [Gammaproteobacteria bacterium]NIV50414.1 5-(carboxyamino)imidazole ribonucleotide mutase [Gammaproteobacteria bacterium]